MPKLGDLSHVRSKNAGPFWITVDIFSSTSEAYEAFKSSPSLGPVTFERLYGADPSRVRHYAVDSLRMVKISYPRTKPQGWYGERDMHAGQQYVKLLDLELAPA